MLDDAGDRVVNVRVDLLKRHEGGDDHDGGDHDLPGPAPPGRQQLDQRVPNEDHQDELSPR